MSNTNNPPSTCLNPSFAINDMRIIGDNGFEHWTVNDVAAEYAIDSVLANKEELTAESLTIHLRYLSENGSSFDIEKALAIALDATPFSR